MEEFTRNGIYAYQQISQSKYWNRILNPSYFKVKKGSNTSSRLNTRIVELKGVEFDHFKE